jgi:RNA polymerase sporulation-specific sigma factor
MIKKINNMELEDLVSRAKSGDNAAYEEIFRRFRGFIYKTCVGIYISGYDMDDLIQLGNITLVKSIKKFDFTKTKNFTAYATSAIRNNYFYEIRQKSKLNSECSLNVETEEGLELLDHIASSENIEEDLLAKESTTELYSALSMLIPRERELIKFVFINDGKLVDYARGRNMNYITCCKLKDRVLKRLRKILGSSDNVRGNRE